MLVYSKGVLGMYFSRSRSKSFSQEMLAKVGLTEDVNEFLRQETVIKLIESAYLNLKNKVEQLIKRLPDDRKESAIDVGGLETLFTKEVKCDFEKSLALSIRCSYSRGEVDDEFLKLRRSELKTLDSECLKRLERSLREVEADLVSNCELIVEMNSRRSSYYSDEEDDSNEVEIYD